MTPGIRTRHQAACRSHTGLRCNCKPSYEASVGAGQAGTKIRRTFRTLAAARQWQAEHRAAAGRGVAIATTTRTVREAAAELVRGMADGTVRTRSGAAYKPSVCRGYESVLRLHVLPDLGGAKLARVRHRDVQALADRMLAAGHDPSTVRNALMPLRTIYRRAVRLGDVATNPVSGVSLPAAPGRRDRVASPVEAAMLIAAVRPSDQALWGAAFYAGLRLGELRALKWSDVDLEHGVIRVERALDQKGATIAPKSRAGRRMVPVPAVLRKLIAAHRLLSVGEGYVFGSSLLTPFTATAVHRRARLRWSKVEPKRLTPIGLHEARHTFASMAIAAGVNAKALTTYMGHSSIQVTYDRYGHMMPGNEQEAAGLLDTYLERSEA